MLRQTKLAGHVAAHRAWGGAVPGRPGFTLPDFTSGLLVVLPGTLPRFLERRGIKLANPVETGELHIWFGPSVGPLDLDIDADPGSTGLIILDGPGPINGRITLASKDHLLVISGSEHGRNVTTHLWGTGTAVFLGQGSSANSVTFLAEGDYVSLQVGDDAMISDDVEVATTDSHGIFELADLSCIINPPASVVIGPHVWLGKSTTVGKGLRVGAGAIIGRGSLVTRDVAAASLVAGYPARVLREGVSWIRPWSHWAPGVEAAMAMITPHGAA